MAFVTLSKVELAVRDVVGTSALLRARALARAGMVASTGTDSAGRIYGRVRDGADEQDVHVLPSRRTGGLDTRQPGAVAGPRCPVTMWRLCSWSGGPNPCGCTANP